jgi:hypothetical protein
MALWYHRKGEISNSEVAFASGKPVNGCVMHDLICRTVVLKWLIVWNDQIYCRS